MKRPAINVLIIFCLTVFIVSMVVLNMTNRHSFRTGEGIYVPNLDGVHEAYSVSQTTDSYYHFVVNVSAERIPEVYLRLTAEVTEPAFFLVEIGTNEDTEKILRKSATDPFHEDVYYLDGISRDKGRAIFSKYNDLFVNDGMVKFGFGAHHGKDEVFVGAYKLFEIYADKPEKYVTTLKELGYIREDHLKTVWQTYTQTTPGKLRCLKGRDKSIWNMVEELKLEGMYFAERRED